MARTVRILTRRDLKELKGIPWSRQRLHEMIKHGLFPPADGKTTDDKNAPNWWFEETIDRWIRLDCCGGSRASRGAWAGSEEQIFGVNEQVLRRG